MKLSITPISFSQSFRQGSIDLDGFIRYVADQELAAIDLLDPAKYAWLWAGQINMQHVRKQLKDAGLAVAAFACGNNFAKLDPEEHKLQIKMVCEAIDKAVEVGTSTLRVFGGYTEATGGDKGVTGANGLPLVIAGIEGCLRKAEQAGVILALENHGSLPGTGDEMLRIMSHFKSPWVRLTYDPANSQGNSMPEDEDPVRVYQRVKSYIRHMHFKDVRVPQVDLTRRREPCIAGDGITPLREIAALLRQDGYDGYCALEFEASRIVDEKTGVTRSLDYLKTL